MQMSIYKSQNRFENVTLGKSERKKKLAAQLDVHSESIADTVVLIVNHTMTANNNIIKHNNLLANRLLC